MVAMFRCVYAEEAGKLGSWGNHGGAGDRRTTLAGSRLVSILSDLLIFEQGLERMVRYG